MYFNNKKHTVEYGIAGTIGKNDMPDRKVLITEGVGTNADFITFGGANPFRFYSNLDIANVNGKLEYELKLGENENSKPKHIIKIGYNGDLSKYDFFNRTIRVNTTTILPSTTIDTNNPQAFFDSNSNNLFYLGIEDPTYKVNILQYINAGYLNYNRNWKKLSLDIGARVEYLFRETRSRTETGDLTKKLDKNKYSPLDINPVLNIKYEVTEQSNLRFTASKTSTKPRFREILPFRFQDGDGNFTSGNKDLKNTQNYNIDFKYEFFPSQGALIAASLFGKRIVDPITRLVEGNSTGLLTKYDNFEEATLYGIEFESAFNLSYIFKESPLANRFTFGLNTIYMKSNEKADPAKFPRLTTTDRSLQGASDFIINTDVVYDLIKNDRTESKLSFIFNTFSERIYAVGTDSAADIAQKPINMLDFTWRNTFSKKYQVNFTIRNILNDDILAVQNPTKEVAVPSRFSNVNNQLTQGVNFGLEFSYTF